MLFCPKCGAILVQKTKNFGCPRCSYTTKEKTDLKTSEKIENNNDIEVFASKDVKVLPVVTEKCKKCKNDKAYFWTVQTRAGDEAETRFFRCVKCDYTWQERGN